MAMTRGGPDMEHDPQLAALYRAGADVAPPAHLDDAIRAAARREVAAGPRRAGVRRWAVPVSLAAVLVLSVSVVTMMREQGADRLESVILPPPETPAVTVPREAAAPATAPESAPPRPSALPPPVAAPAEPVAKAGSAPVQTFDRASAGRATEAEQGTATAGNEFRAKAAAADTTRTEDASARRESAHPQPQMRSAPAPMADVASGAGMSAKPAAPAAALSAAPARSPLWQDLVREPPEKWMQRIAELRRAGQTADAEALVAEFHRRFPDQRLPEDLR